MRRFSYDIIGISEVRWTGKGETSNGDFIWSREEKLHMRGVGFLISAQANKALIGYAPISPRVILTRFAAVPFDIIVIHARILPIPKSYTFLHRLLTRNALTSDS
jgi:hypothetical protein